MASDVVIQIGTTLTWTVCSVASGDTLEATESLPPEGIAHP